GAMVGSIEALIAVRTLQGAVSNGPYVVMAGMVRSLFDDTRAVRVIGFLGSVQSLVPAIAPIPGAWLAANFGWASTLLTTGIVAAAVFAALALAPQLLPAGRTRPSQGGGTYRALLVNGEFLRQAI